MRFSFSAALLAAGLLCSTVPAMAANRNVDIINQTGQPIVKFYASNTGTNSWEENILGNDPVRPGETQPINIDDGSGACRFDFKAVFADGSSSVESNINVCQVSSVTYH